MDIEKIQNPTYKRIYLFRDISNGKYDAVMGDSLKKRFLEVIKYTEEDPANLHMVDNLVCDFITDWGTCLRIDDERDVRVNEFLMRCMYVADLMDFERFKDSMIRNTWSGRWYKPEQTDVTKADIEDACDEKYQANLSLAKDIAEYKYAKGSRADEYEIIFEKLVNDHLYGGLYNKEEFIKISDFLKSALETRIIRYYGSKTRAEALGDNNLKEILERLSE